MAAVTPDTELYLIKCPIAIDNSNQLTFESVEEQQEYFLSLEHVHAVDFTYQRKDYTIRYPDNVDNFLGYNYCMYRNNHYTDKWFYAFIVNMNYVNDNMTEIKIKTDVFQTWQFDLEYKQSFIIREHTNDDSFGSNLEPEDLETGEYIVNSSEIIDLGEPITCVCATVKPAVSPTSFNGGGEYGGISSGYKIYGYNQRDYLEAHLKHLQNGYTDSVIGIFMYPEKFCFNNPGWTQGQECSEAGDVVGKSFTLPSTVDGYVPHNKKLFQYPFSYCLIDNKAGTQKVLHYEKFGNIIDNHQNTFSISCLGVANISSSWLIRPYKYNVRYDTSSSYLTQDYIPGAKFPQCGWVSDSYTNWLTQQSKNISLQEQQARWNFNQNQIEVDRAKKNLDYATGADMGAFFDYFTQWIKLAETGMGSAPGISMLVKARQAKDNTNYDLQSIRNKQAIDYSSEIGAIEAAKYQHSFSAQTASGQTNLGDAMFYDTWLNPTVEKMSVRKEFAEKIDKYFDMFGYATNKMKLPNIIGRENWNYLKTSRINIVANIPQTDLKEIKDMFDNGVTLWHNPDTFLDYSQSNEII